MKPIKLNVKTKSENYPIIIGSNIIKNLDSYNLGVYTYSLHTQRIKNPQGEIDCLKFGPEPIYSTYHSALFWLTACGFKKFEIYGVSKTGKYDSLFKDNNDVGNTRDLTWYDLNYRIGLSILNRNNCEYEIK